MTCDELKAAINDEIAQNARIAAIRSRIDAGTADFLDSELYTAITAEITAEQMRRNVLALSDREPSFVGVVRERYTDTFATFNAVQRILDAVTGIRIRTVQPEFENDRAHKIGHSLNDPTVPESVIERRAYSATENFVRSQHDRCTQANASFRSRAGLDCRITRTGGAKCCDWCASVSGSFTTSSAPDGIWGRHDNCKCSITYETRRGSFQQLSGSGKGWDTVEELPDIPLHVLDGSQTGTGDVHAVSAEQAQTLQKKHSLEVLTGGQKPAIINQKISDRMFNSHVYTDDEKKLVELGVIPFYEIEEALMASPIGRHVAQYIESQSMAIELDYISDSNGLSGEINDPFITVYVADMRTIEEVVETIVHETAHKQFDWQYTQEDEVNCRIYEYLSTHDEISEQKIHEIVDFVRENYSDFPEGNLYGY